MTPDARAGASFALSFLIVAIAAIALYRPESTAEPASATLGNAPPETRGTPSPPPPTAGVARADPPQSGRLGGEAPPSPGPRPPVAEADVPAGKPIGHPPFTRVLEGESLIDLARRVYGTSDAAPAIRSANRDQLEGSGTTLRAGSLLRTP